MQATLSAGNASRWSIRAVINHPVINCPVIKTPQWSNVRW